MNTTPHAGFYVKAWLRENGRSQAELAAAMNVKEPFVSKIVNGHAHVSPKVALKLEAVTHVPAATWAGYEMARALEVARMVNV